MRSIDGVLHRAGKTLPHAAAAVATLQRAGVPFTFLTNGGGKTEAEKAAELSAMLGGVPVDPELYIQSHTPFRELAPRYANRSVVVVGQDPCKARAILLGYDFPDVVTTGQLHAALPDLWPFAPGPASHPVCRDAAGRAAPVPAADTRYAAAFVVNDPAHWQLDLQVLVDLLVSDGGRLGTTAARGNSSGGSSSNGSGPRGAPGTPRLYFSASDLEFSSAWPVPRFGQGSFLASLRGIWAAKTGGAGDDFPHELHGKPMASQYSFVERTERALQETRAGRHCALERNYMVGDNPESDIRGALGYNSSQGTRWLGVLVRTGVWDGVSPPSVAPSHVADGVKEAVELIGELEGVDLTVA